MSKCEKELLDTVAKATEEANNNIDHLLKFICTERINFTHSSFLANDFRLVVKELSFLVDEALSKLEHAQEILEAVKEQKE